MLAPNRVTLTLATVVLLAGVGLLIAHGQADFAVVAIAALGVLLTLARSWTLRTGRAFVHGYHAGYHDASQRDGEVTREPCPVLDLADQANDRYRQLPA